MSRAPNRNTLSDVFPTRLYSSLPRQVEIARIEFAQRPQFVPILDRESVVSKFHCAGSAQRLQSTVGSYNRNAQRLAKLHLAERQPAGVFRAQAGGAGAVKLLAHEVGNAGAHRPAGIVGD